MTVTGGSGSGVAAPTGDREGPVRRPGRAWGRPRVVLDPLAALLRQSCVSRAELARRSGLGYQMLRTYTDGLWTADRPPPERVLAGLARVVDPAELAAAVLASLAHRADQEPGAVALSRGQRVVLEALRGFDDARLLAAAPQVYELVAGLDLAVDGAAAGTADGAGGSRARPPALGRAGRSSPGLA